MKSVIFAVIATLLVIVQVSAYSVICKEHFITTKNASCLDFQKGTTGFRVRIVDLIGMNPLINCNDDEAVTIKKGTKICVTPNHNVVNRSIKRAKIGKNLTCKGLTKHLGLKPNQAYVIDNFNRALTCEMIKDQEGNIIDYCADNNYNPDFRNSKRVYKEN